jgi:hypothetical protein
LTHKPESIGIQIEVPASHLYPGLVVALPEIDLPPADAGARKTEKLACMLAFNDGSISFGDLHWYKGDWILAVNAYVTARKTQVAARRWLLDIKHLPDGRLSGRVTKRLV